MTRHFLLSALAVFFLATCAQKPADLPDFQIEPGFRMELVVSEPLIKDPVDLEFSERGKAWVLEMPGYPFGDQQSRIVILNDTDGDGVFDQRQHFADSLQQASSLLLYKNGALVAAPPYLLHVSDLDGNYEADAIDTLMGGFATGNLQHNFNGLTYGLDGWIYAANGGNSGQPYWWGDSLNRVDLRGEDFRFHLARKKLERLGESSGGFGLAVNEWGHIFETHNLEHISHLVFPSRYVQDAALPFEHTLTNISDHEENGLSRIYPIGEQESRVNHPEQSGYFSGACGITYYGGGALGEAMENTIWVADVVLNLVHIDKVNPQGAGFSASRLLEKKDFLASTDRSFRPVNMTVGPNGSMYLVDMHRDVIEHPEWIPDEIEKTLDLNAGKEKGRIYRISTEQEKSNPVDLRLFQSKEGFMQALAHPNQWVRTTAHRLLMSGDDFPATELTQLLSSPQAVARLHAAWMLYERNLLQEEALQRLLRDESPGVRENALRMAEEQVAASSILWREAQQLLQDRGHRVRLQAALTISTLPPDFRRAHEAELVQAIARAAGQPHDEWLAGAWALAARPVVPALFSHLLPSTRDAKHDMLLNALARVVRNEPAAVTQLLTTISTAQVSLALKRAVVAELSATRITQLPGSGIESIKQLEKTGDLPLITALARLRQQLRVPASPAFISYSRQAAMALADTSLADTVRLAHLQLLAYLPFSEKQSVLFRCLQSTEPLAIQEGVLRQLSVVNDRAVGQQLVALWSTLGPQARKWAGNLLLYNEIHHDVLLTALEQKQIGIGEMNFDLERRRMLLWWTDDVRTRQRAEALFSDAGVTSRAQAVASMKEALKLPGAATTGHDVFVRICSQCHVYGNEGKHVGPVLSEIGRKSKETLLHDILDPNAAVDTRYISHRVETADGRVHFGIVERETDQHIVLVKMGGEKETITKSDIKKFNSLGTSLMMEGLENSLSHQEMADLLAFLQNNTPQSLTHE
ncbi:MAG: PVC-type heme-binding CxxCH protein [Bacteroidota bacterium]